MEAKEIQNKIEEVRNASKERQFSQTFDFIVNLQQMDLKKPEHKVDTGLTIYSPVKAKPLKICAVVDHGVEGAEEVFDKVIYNDELESYKGDMKKIRSLTHNFDKFVVQSNYMPLFAQVLGRYLGPLGKMPSPKLGMVITPKTPLKPLYDKLQRTVHIQTKKNLVVQVPIGSEKESDETIAKNVVAVYQGLVQALPNHEHCIKEKFLKLTMGKKVVL